MSKNAKLPTGSYKGVRDFYPEQYANLKHIFSIWRMVAERAGYVEYEASILEPAELYKAKGAENEEMVKEQTYTFTDRGGREVTLRPEMTPTVARMVAARRRELGFPLRLYSIPNLFRYERPQRGRLREHWQLNVDLFGSKSSAADAEILGVAYGIMRAFGASESDFVIKVSSRKILDKQAATFNLNPDQQKELRVLLDKKGKIPDEELKDKVDSLVGGTYDWQASPSPDIATIISDFEKAGIKNIIFDPSIVRGFDYYTGMVFEVFDTHPDNNRSLFGGGRYDNLTKLFDDEPLPGVGFGMGDETIRLFMDVRGLTPPYTPPTQAYIAVTSPSVLAEATKLAGELRQAGVCVALDFGEKKLGDQIKAAAKHAIPYVIIVGQDELMAGAFTVRNLSTGAEEHVGRERLASYFLTLNL